MFNGTNIVINELPMGNLFLCNGLINNYPIYSLIFLNFNFLLTYNYKLKFFFFQIKINIYT